jgi:hypothetical protein
LEKNGFQDKRKLANYQEHNIPSWKSLARIKIIVVLKFYPIEKTHKENKRFDLILMKGKNLPIPNLDLPFY